LTAFLELEPAIRAAERPEDCGARDIKMDNCRGSGKSLLDFVAQLEATKPAPQVVNNP
jgi:hypothetical protein